MLFGKGLQRIDRLPKALGPNSAPPWNHATIFPSAINFAVDLYKFSGSVYFTLFLSKTFFTYDLENLEPK